MPRYLSPEWLDAAQAAIDGCSSMRVASNGAPIVVQHVVVGSADGDVTYHVQVDEEGTHLRAGEAPDPTVVFTEDYETASAIGRGELSAQGAFLTGRIRVHGALPRLVEHSAAFADLEDVLAGLRAET